MRVGIAVTTKNDVIAREAGDPVRRSAPQGAAADQFASGEYWVARFRGQ
jgi:hypothetical protein